MQRFQNQNVSHISYCAITGLTARQFYEHSANVYCTAFIIRTKSCFKIALYSLPNSLLTQGTVPHMQLTTATMNVQRCRTQRWSPNYLLFPCREFTHVLSIDSRLINAMRCKTLLIRNIITLVLKSGIFKNQRSEHLIAEEVVSKEKWKNTAPGTEGFPAYLCPIKFNASKGSPPSTFFTQQETMQQRVQV